MYDNEFKKKTFWTKKYKFVTRDTFSKEEYNYVRIEWKIIKHENNLSHYNN